MDLTVNKSQLSDDESNKNADLQHVPNNQADSDVTSNDSLFASEKREDAYTIDEKTH